VACTVNGDGGEGGGKRGCLGADQRRGCLWGGLLESIEFDFLRGKSRGNGRGGGKLRELEGREGDTSR
jgi:hypothetical protein